MCYYLDGINFKKNYIISKNFIKFSKNFHIIFKVSYLMTLYYFISFI